MPLKINRNATVTITPAFIDAFCSIYEKWARANVELINRGATNQNYSSYTMTAHRLRPIVRRQSPGPREGLDYELTRFRVLPYAAFDAVTGPLPGKEEGQILWLVGTTRHVTATYYNRRSEVAGELGCYNVYIPETIATNPNLFDIHMIPQRNPNARARHYHHGIVTYPDVEATRDPLTYRTDNCFGDYQGTLNSLLTVPDFPELFRQLHRHLSTYGDRPPYGDLPFDTRSKEG